MNKATHPHHGSLHLRRVAAGLALAALGALGALGACTPQAEPPTKLPTATTTTAPTTAPSDAAPAGDAGGGSGAPEPSERPTHRPTGAALPPDDVRLAPCPVTQSTLSAADCQAAQRAMAQARPGRAAIDAPARMREGQTTEVTLVM